MKSAFIRVSQSGGKYGSTVCPVCSCPDANWKFSSSIGGCPNCEAGFYAFEGGAHEILGDHPHECDHYFEVCIEVEPENDPTLMGNTVGTLH